jgi:hypothetical protein
VAARLRIIDAGLSGRRSMKPMSSAAILDRHVEARPTPCFDARERSGFHARAWAELSRDQILGPRAQAGADVIAGDDEIGTVIWDTAHHEMHMRVVVPMLTDLRAFTRDLAGQMESDLSTRLDWVGIAPSSGVTTKRK